MDKAITKAVNNMEAKVQAAEHILRTLHGGRDGQLKPKSFGPAAGGLARAEKLLVLKTWFDFPKTLPLFIGLISTWKKSMRKKKQARGPT